jgi:cytochrome c oxidase subunit 3
MEATVVKTGTEGKTWGGGNEPLKASYGKMMMWFFIVSDSLTFAGFLSSYGMSRFKFIDAWPIADEVFTHFPFLHGVEAPMYYVAFMTFILIFSSVTMVLAVDAGHKMQQKKVIFYLFLTIIGGLIFLSSQAWEWKTFIKGDYGAVETHGGQIIQFLNKDGERVALADFAAGDKGERVEQTKEDGIWFMKEAEYKPSVSFEQVKEGFLANDNLLLRIPNKDEHGKHIVLSREESIAKLVNDGNMVVEGANLRHNEYGHPLFADFFFFITGFHGFHVSIGVLLNCIVFFNVIIGTYERRGHYEMVEKVGLYWHFVDLVWVFVFTFFYLV